MAVIYCFTGLGADERLYAHVKLNGFELQPVQWIQHLPAETLPQYAKRLSAQITEPRPLLLGVSFGGMLAIEAAKLLQARQTIIVSSIQSSHQLSFLHHLAYKLKLIELLPPRLLVTPTLLMDYLFGAESNDDKKLLHSFMQNTQPHYLKWALKAIINWKNKIIPNNLTHIHGANDRVIPLPKGVHHTIAGCGHLMIYNRAAVINPLLQNILP